MPETKSNKDFEVTFNSKSEPLGATISRNYNWPEPSKQEEFRFGVPTKGSNPNNLLSVVYLYQVSLRRT